MASEPLRVALVIQDLGSGGAERQLVLLANALEARGARVHVATYGDGQHFAGGFDAAVGERYVRLRRGRLSLGLPLALRRWLRAVDPHVVVSFLTGATRWVGLSAFPGRKWRWVVAERSVRSLGTQVRGYLRLARRADLVVANSHTAVTDLRAAGLPDVRYLPNGIPLPPPPPPREPGPVRLLAVGSIQAVKNHRLLAPALARLPGDWILDHVGRASEPELAAAIAEDVRRMGLSGRVTFHGEVRDVASFYRRAHLMILPSAFEGFPNVLLEAWAHGCAALVSDRCDLPLLVRSGETGWSFPLDDADGLARVLAEVVALGTEKLGAVGLAGYEEVRSRYTMDAVSAQWHHLLAEVAGRELA